MKQRLVAVHAKLKKSTNAPIASALGLAEAFEFKSKVAIDCLNSLDEIVNNPVCLLRPTHDSLAFQKTVFMAITRTPPPANAESQVKRDYKESLSNLAKYLELHKGSLSNTQLWYDCGVFVCTFAEHIMFDRPMEFSQDDITRGARNHIALTLINERQPIELD